MLRIALHASPALALVLTVAHAGAIGAIAVVSLPSWVALPAIGVVVVSMAHGLWRRALLRSPASVTAIEVAADDVLSIRTRRGVWSECEVLGDTYVMWFLTVLNLRRRDDGKRISVVLLPDALNADDFRKLRTWLRWKAAAHPSGAERRSTAEPS